MTDPKYTLTTAVDEERERGAAILLEEFGSEENFLAALEATVKDFDDGDIVEGVVVKVDPEEVLLDIGFKSEGVIPSRELSIKHDIDPNEVVAVGDVIEALVLQKEDKDGRLVLSKKRAQYERAWGKIEEIHERESTVTGSVIEVVKGGLILDIGLRGFLPASLVEMRRVRDLHPYVGQELECKVIELDKNRNNVVLSRRKFLEETQSEFRREFLETLQKGEIRKGTVSSCVNFGAFVDLGGVDGLVHVSELSWKHVDHPGEVVELGQEVEVEVLDVDLERERVSLSLKATQEDPWQQFARQHYVGEFVEGSVTKLVPFGAFVKVEDGIEGLIHISELADAHVEQPEQVVKVGDSATVKIIDIDDVRRRISLSLKQAVKAGYGEAPEIEEVPAYAAEAPSSGGGGGGSSSSSGDGGSAMGAALAQAMQRSSGSGGGSEDAEAEAGDTGLSAQDIIARVQAQAAEVAQDDAPVGADDSVDDEPAAVAEEAVAAEAMADEVQTEAPPADEVAEAAAEESTEPEAAEAAEVAEVNDEPAADDSAEEASGAEAPEATAEEAEAADEPEEAAEDPVAETSDDESEDTPTADEASDEEE
ncbi:30S ribosomal protein S1 [Euzebya tangerina]|uniref:30S ribosomal protein S1 n=1 Tax=Euzebya tangerina TaxID=591198 RepID=UPI0014735110|nr:30S ribosomal protein S1 [Euzebya tangerina]